MSKRNKKRPRRNKHGSGNGGNGSGSSVRRVVESPTNLRLVCVHVLIELQTSGGSLTRLLPQAQLLVADSEKARLQAWCFGCCRWAHQLGAIVDGLLQKPMKAKDLDVHMLMQLGIFQLLHSSLATHAAVDETVKVTRRLRKDWSKGLVNAVLRTFSRSHVEIAAALPEYARYSHPPWLLSQLKNDWPQNWQRICEENNRQAPMTLRVNSASTSCQEYSASLAAQAMACRALEYAPDSLVLDQPVPVWELPGFETGEISVQDAAAQLAADYLMRLVPRGGRLLDACSAPGGKTAHILEKAHFTSVLAVDKDNDRLAKVQETVIRLGVERGLELRCGDALELDQWWDGQKFDAVLLDAPCSGTGVIRRHPDIKLLRRETDIADLVQLQGQLLDVLWTTLKEGGVMLYATCSVLKAENEQQVNQFLERFQDAQLIGDVQQILPGENQMDGFFYAPLSKRA
ncbi:MAG: 16S rRNA (cytosine(967)-C(5))-methyltransferase RsmB [Granulosicoccus sp.]